MKRKLEAKLLAWKSEGEGRKPLLMNGARQTGKTYLLRAFGEAHFANTVYINLEADAAAASYFDADLDPRRLVRYLEAASGERIVAGETLLILDEIQSCERALTSLKYFCEELPQLHVAAAGSPLGVAVNRERYSFPVGKVTLATLHPLDFEEYLWARGWTALCEEIRRSAIEMTPLPEPLHGKAVELYREYLLIGGMPASINAFLARESLLDAGLAQNDILTSYLADMAKYATPAESVKIRGCFDSLPAQLAKDNKKFQYKVVQKGGSSTMFGASIEWLRLAGVVMKCSRLEQAIYPLAASVDLSAFKLYLGDVGLLSAKAGVSRQAVLSGEGSTFMGALTENYVAQQLTALGYPLYYWESGNTAELDFVLQKEGDIVGVEVKAGEHVRSRSLSVFTNIVRPAYNIRLSLKNFGSSDGLRSIPLYAAFCI